MLNKAYSFSALLVGVCAAFFLSYVFAPAVGLVDPPLPIVILAMFLLACTALNLLVSEDRNDRPLFLERLDGAQLILSGGLAGVVIYPAVLHAFSLSGFALALMSQVAVVVQGIVVAVLIMLERKRDMSRKGDTGDDPGPSQQPERIHPPRQKRYPKSGTYFN